MEGENESFDEPATQRSKELSEELDFDSEEEVMNNTRRGNIN